MCVCVSPSTPSRGKSTSLKPCSASLGDYSDAIETLLTAIAVIKQSRVANDERCRVLLSSLKDCLHGIEAKSYSTGASSSSSRYRRLWGLEPHRGGFVAPCLGVLLAVSVPNPARSSPEVTESFFFFFLRKRHRSRERSPSRSRESSRRHRDLLHSEDRHEDYFQERNREHDRHRDRDRERDRHH